MESNLKKIKTYPNTIIIDWTDKLEREHGYKTIKKIYDGYLPLKDAGRKKEYLLNQKPACMLDCAKRVKENLIFFDGDIRLQKQILKIYFLKFF